MFFKSLAILGRMDCRGQARLELGRLGGQAAMMAPGMTDLEAGVENSESGASIFSESEGRGWRRVGSEKGRKVVWPKDLSHV